MRKNVFLKEIVLIFLGTLFAGMGMGSFLLPNKLSSGGFAGIATIFYYFFNLNVGLTVIVLNIPFFILAYIKMGKKFLARTITGTVLLSLFIDLFEYLPLLTNDRLLASIYGGVLIGIGTGIIFKAHTSTGGTDLIVQIVRSYKVKISNSNLLVFIDICVVVLNVICFREFEVGLYSAIAIFIDGLMIDIIFEGINFSKLVFVVSNKNEEILNMIHNDLNSGATEIYGRGSYSDEKKIVIMSAMPRRDITILREKVYEIDKNAFLIVANAREVYGLGFKSIE
ncbi:MAG: YitT family protein [Clostridia bacterium]|jgi:uncharacterized membrane-anchored protein YitT (DUF2179 family)|nr:YitT family protein [Clostridia bacterium]